MLDYCFFINEKAWYKTAKQNQTPRENNKYFTFLNNASFLSIYPKQLMIKIEITYVAIPKLAPFQTNEHMLKKKPDKKP